METDGDLDDVLPGTGEPRAGIEGDALPGRVPCF